MASPITVNRESPKADSDPKTFVSINDGVPLILSLNGNIGSGKSKRMEQCSEAMGQAALSHTICDEPVGEFVEAYVPDADYEPEPYVTNAFPRKVVSSETCSPLFDQYDVPSTAKALFQIFAYMTRLEEQQTSYLNASANQSFVFSERDLDSDRLFARVGYERGEISKLGWATYNKATRVYAHLKPSATVYIRTDPDVCWERILHRARGAEVGIKREYIEHLHRAHEDWYGPNGKNPADVILDGNVDVDALDEKELDDYLRPVIDLARQLSEM